MWLSLSLFLFFLMDERRRQRRQQRILASGQSRLGKITSTAFRNKRLVFLKIVQTNHVNIQLNRLIFQQKEEIVPRTLVRSWVHHQHCYHNSMIHSLQWAIITWMTIHSLQTILFLQPMSTTTTTTTVIIIQQSAKRMSLSNIGIWSDYFWWRYWVYLLLTRKDQLWVEISSLLYYIKTPSILHIL